MKKSHKNLLLNFVFIIGMLLSYYNVVCCDFSAITSEPKIECSSESASLSSDYDFSEDDHYKPINHTYFFSSNCIRGSKQNSINLFINSPVDHWQPPKV